MSKRLERLFFRLALLCRIKYFCAWLATCVGVLDVTKFRAIPRQSPFPNFWRPIKNSRCSSSVHGTPERQIQYKEKISNTPFSKKCKSDRFLTTKWMATILFYITNSMTNIWHPSRLNISKICKTSQPELTNC